MPSSLTETLTRLAGETAGRPAADFAVQKLKGDASSRSYYRLSAKGRSYIAMVLPEDAGKSEEATKGEAPPELPFLNVHRWLERAGTPVPRIDRVALDVGVLLLEDLGDTTLEAGLKDGGEATRDRLYGEAIDLLAALRAGAELGEQRDCIAFERAFDFDLLRWELDHYVEYGLRARTGHQLSPAEERLLAESGDRICRSLAELPRGFTHRDYQSRNLMVTPRGIVVIDFQDALLGPRQYDLVALLRDSYVELPPDFIDRMLHRYQEGLARGGVQPEPFDAFRRAFDLLTVQRKLKDGGRFEFSDR
ncbi:MAG: aminoglycoside phosphotransferase family protein, partial [Deltaproteobacteria bacterium]